MSSRTSARQRPFAYFDTRLGRCALSWSESGITAVQLPERTLADTLNRLSKRFKAASKMEESVPPPAVRKAIAALSKQLNGERTDLTKVPIDFEGVPPFHRKVYQAARKIPSGVTVSYGELAAAAGSPQAARAVGQAMARNPFPLVIPCHRVKAGDGSIGGFSAYRGCDLKQELLDMECKDKEVEEATSSRRERKFAKAKAAPERKLQQSQLKYKVDVALAHLAKADRKLALVIEQIGGFRLELDEMLTPFETLAESIVYQQLTGKAAATIFARVKALYGGTRLPSPALIIETKEETLRSAGLSRAKALALLDLAQKQHEGLIPTLAQLEKMDDEQIIETLSAVRGVGRWTVEMLLIFRLGRADVLPVNDYGVRKGFARVYGKKELPTPRELAAYGERWRPYRSVASWYMWRATELK